MVSEELKIIIKAEAQNAVRELKSIQGSTMGIGSNLKALAGPMLRIFGPAAIAAGIGKAASASIQFAAALEKQQVAFEVLLGSADKATRLFDEIKDFSAATPFQLPDLTTGAQRLLAFGVAADDVVQTLEDLGNASQGNSATLDRLTNAYGKLLAKGKATLEELNMFTEAGVPIMQALQEQLGLTKEELFDYITKGKVGFEDVNQALQNLTRGEGQFAGMLEKQSQTLAGAFSTLKDNVQLTGAAFAEDFLPFLRESVKWLTSVFQKIREAKVELNAQRDLFDEFLTGFVEIPDEASASEATKLIEERIEMLKEFAALVEDVVAERKRRGGILGDDETKETAKYTTRRLEMMLELAKRELASREARIAAMAEEAEAEKKLEEARQAEADRQAEIEGIRAKAQAIRDEYLPEQKTEAEILQEQIDLLAGLRSELESNSDAYREVQSVINGLVKARDEYLNSLDTEQRIEAASPTAGWIAELTRINNEIIASEASARRESERSAEATAERLAAIDREARAQENIQALKEQWADDEEQRLAEQRKLIEDYFDAVAKAKYASMIGTPMFADFDTYVEAFAEAEKQAAREIEEANKALEEQERILQRLADQAWEGFYNGLMNLAGSGAIELISGLSEAMFSAAQGTEKAADALQDFAQTIMNSLPQLLFDLGVALIKAGQIEAGAIVLAASGLAAIGKGIFDAATTEPTTTSESSDQYRDIPRNTVVYHTPVTVHGSVIRESELDYRISSVTARRSGGR